MTADFITLSAGARFYPWMAGTEVARPFLDLAPVFCLSRWESLLTEDYQLAGRRVSYTYRETAVRGERGLAVNVGFEFHPAPHLRDEIGLGHVSAASPGRIDFVASQGAVSGLSQWIAFFALGWEL